MDTQIIIGIIMNTLAFGAMSFSNNKLGIDTPLFFKHDLVSILISVLYILSFILILFAPGTILIKICICLMMQFLINHIIWGTVTGIVSARVPVILRTVLLILFFFVSYIIIQLSVTFMNVTDYDCSDFTSWDQAQEFYIESDGILDDVDNLDSDRDGIACESLIEE